MPFAQPANIILARIRLNRVARRRLWPGPSLLVRAREICGMFKRSLTRNGQRAIPASTGNPWVRYWGESYGPKLKQKLLKPVFEMLEKEGRSATSSSTSVAERFR